MSKIINFIRKNILLFIPLALLILLRVCVKLDYLSIDKIININLLDIIILTLFLLIILRKWSVTKNKRLINISLFPFLICLGLLILNEYFNIFENSIRSLLYFFTIIGGYMILVNDKNDTDSDPPDKRDCDDLVYTLIIIGVLIFYFYFSFFFHITSEISINTHVFAVNTIYYSDTYQVIYILESFFHNISNFNNIFWGNDFSTNNYAHYYALWQTPLTIIYSVFRIVFEQVLSYNLLLLSVVVSSFVTAYLFFRDYFSTKYSILGALLYIIIPYFISQLSIGHIGALYYPLFPLIFKSLHNNRFISEIRYSFLLGLSFLIVSLTEWHLSYFILLIITVASFLMLLKYRSLRFIKIIPTLVLLTFFIFSFVYIFNVKKVNVNDSGGKIDATIAQTLKYSPEPNNLIDKSNIENELGSTEKTIFLGPLLIFLILGLYLFKKESVFKIVTISFLWCSLGAKVYPSLYTLLFDYFPFFSFNRSPSRFFFIITPLIVLYILHSIKIINKKINLKYFSIMNILIIFCIPILFIQINKFNLSNNCKEITEVITPGPKDHRAIIIPINDVNNYRNSYYLNFFTCSGIPLVNGYTGFETEELKELNNNIMNLNDNIREDNIIFLRENNVRYIIFDKNNDRVDKREWLNNIDPKIIKKITTTFNYIFIEI